MAATRLSDGRVRLEGRAPGGAVVTLASPDVAPQRMAADARGAWMFELPPSDRPRLFALSAELAGRTVRGEGALAAPPPPATGALLLRGGAAAQPVGGVGGGVRLTAVDFDAGGGLGAAGAASPGAEVRLSIDGAATGAGRADARGAFSLMAVRAAMAPGAHLVRIDTPKGGSQSVVTTSPPAPLGDRPYRADRIPGGWRIDWTPPGGGVQSVAVLDPPGGRP